jgi:hypothetical protein
MRRSASQTLAAVLAERMGGTSDEVDIADAWHLLLNTDSTTCAEGWYLPPPHGLAVLIADPPSFDRLNRPSFRSRSAWPSRQHRLSGQALLVAYSSRVNHENATIGDMGCTLYFGADQSIKRHLSTVWNITMRIARLAEPGMSFSQLYRDSIGIIDASGLRNNIYSISDSNSTNVGHTIPWSDRPISAEERTTLKSGDPQTIADLVSSSRRFISSTEEHIFTETMAFTIEPRLSGPGLPVATFHVVVSFDRGDRNIITEFAPLFALTGFEPVD